MKRSSRVQGSAVLGRSNVMQGQCRAGQGRAVVTWDLVMPPFMLRSIRGLTARPNSFSLSPCGAQIATAAAPGSALLSDALRLCWQGRLVG